MIYNLTVKLFLFIIPFLYYTQVLLYRNDFVPIPYLVVFSAMLLTHHARRKTFDITGKKGVELLDSLVAFFIFINFVWVFFELATRDYKNALRVLIYYVIPLFLYFYISRYMKEKDVNHILLILALTSIVVAGESLYERYYNIILLKSCSFQNKNFNYVATLGYGEELTQLKYITYRAPGILEHIHATATYIGLGVISSLYLFLCKKNKIWLMFLIVGFTALVILGGRTALIATLISAFVFLYLQKTYLERRTFKMIKLFLTVVVFLVISVFLIFNYSPLEHIYEPLFTGEVLQEHGFINIPEGINGWWKGITKMPIGLLFGYGPGATLRMQLGVGSDDFFVIDIVGRYGVIGSLLFYFIFVVFAKEALFSLRKSPSILKSEDKEILILFISVSLLLILTTIHSGALIRKSIFPWLFVAYGIGRRYIYGDYRSVIK